MANLFAGPATMTFRDGSSLDATVDLWRTEKGRLIQWGGTAETSEPGALWDGEQRVCTVRFGDAASGYRVGSCTVVEPEPADDVERVALRGSGDLAVVETPVT